MFIDDLGFNRLSFVVYRLSFLRGTLLFKPPLGGLGVFIILLHIFYLPETCYNK